MSASKSSNPIAPAVGLRSVLNEKSRARREEQRALVDIGLRSPALRNDLLPDLAISNMPVDRLKPASRRVRRASAKQRAKVQASIRRFGICAPILVDQDDRIVHGHLVWEAARQEGLAEVPAIRIGHLSPSELRLLSIALNRLGETGEWDAEARASLSGSFRQKSARTVAP